MVQRAMFLVALLSVLLLGTSMAASASASLPPNVMVSPARATMAFLPNPPFPRSRNDDAVSFRPTGSTTATSARRKSPPPLAAFAPLFAKKRDADDNGDEDEGEEDRREGMRDAFAALDALNSLDDDDVDDAASAASAAKTGGVAYAISFGGSPEEEVKLLKGMMSELEQEGEEGMYSTILDEMGGGREGDDDEAKGAAAAATTGGGGGGNVLDDADGIGSTASSAADSSSSAAAAAGGGDDDDTLLIFKPPEQPVSGGNDRGTGQDVGIIGEPDMEKFMADAIREAVDEARSKTPEEIASAGPTSPESIYDDEEMMKQITNLFDDANTKLVESVKEMQIEQAELAKKNAQERQDAVQESELRLAEAEEGVQRLMQNVMKETAEVEKAMADLQAAKDQMNADPLGKMVDLKGGGIVKQGAFVGAVLFSLRSVAEVAQMMTSTTGGEDHATAAAIQGVIAAACAAYLALG